MTENFSVEDFDSPPPPPRILYKYLSAERMENVLAGGAVRFSSLLNTNDSFEVRSTFHKFAGPRFLQMLAEQMEVTASDEKINDKIVEILKEAGLSGISPDIARQFLEQHYRTQFMTVLRAQMQLALDYIMVPYLNSQKNAEELLNKLGRRLLCFSLSERYDSPPMLAHYAGNHSGLVVSFDTDHDWFQRRKDGRKTRLQKVAYFDGKVEEPLENVQAAFISKTTDWGYEREWRVYVNEDQVDRTVGDPSDPVHLLSFPPDAVRQVIVGAKATDETVSRIREVAADKYPGTELLRATPDRVTHTYQLDPT